MKYLLLTLLFFSSVAEVYRLPILTSLWISLIDVVLPIIFVVFFFKTALIRNKISFFPWSYPIIIFIVFALFSLLINIPILWLSINESISSFLYLFRFSLFILIILISYNLPTSEKKELLNWLFYTAFLIFVFWLIQLKYFWNFYRMEMNNLWWDPHIWRMLSTWFDPNYLGWYFAFISSIAIWKIFEDYLNNKKINYYLLSLIVLLIIWIILTYSRSAILALIISVVVQWFFISKRLLIIGLLCMTLLIWISPRFQERFISGIESAYAMFIDNEKALDPTAKLRVSSWNTWISIFYDSPIIWAWFNTLPLIQKKKWSFMTESHASSWIDSSIITVMATTWIIWLALFMLFYTKVIYHLFSQKSFLSIGVWAWIIGIFVHSIFVNSLFFYAFLPSFFISIGLSIKKT